MMYVCLWLWLCFSVLINVLSKIRNHQLKKELLQTFKQILIIHYLHFLGGKQVARNSIRLQHLFWSRRLACLCLLSGHSQFVFSSQCHIDNSIHSHCSGKRVTFLILCLAFFYIVSTKKFWIFERINKFNFYIQVQNSNYTFPNPLTSENYTENMPLIFLKLAVRNMWSITPNRCRSSLEQHDNFTLPEDLQYLDGTISNNEVLILSRQIVYTKLYTGLILAFQNPVPKVYN
jgi:hypothetical protein